VDETVAHVKEKDELGFGQAVINEVLRTGVGFVWRYELLCWACETKVFKGQPLLRMIKAVIRLNF
jgi:hypothetical protein